MIDNSISGMAYNRFDNLDSINERIIYYLISPNNKTPAELEQTHIIWRLLYYNDVDALKKPLPSYEDIIKLICKDNSNQHNYRIFTSAKLEDGWSEECSILKIYIDSIIPYNHISALVNIGVEVIVNTKIMNVSVPETDTNVIVDYINDIPIRIQNKSRVSMLTKAVLSLLNGANVAGVGKMIFSREQSIFNQSQYGIWNNRNFEGMKNVIGVTMSGAI